LETVSNLLGKATGTTITVTNWNLNTVTTNFHNYPAGVKFLLFGYDHH